MDLVQALTTRGELKNGFAPIPTTTETWLADSLRRSLRRILRGDVVVRRYDAF
jgi:hypothetical protein